MTPAATTPTPDATLPAAENPLGVDGFEFVEFTGPDPQAMIRQLETMGFVQTHVNPRTNVVRLKQGDISFLVHRTPTGQAGEFARDHGPSANGMAFRVNDAKAAYDSAIARGAQSAHAHAGGALGEGAYVLRGIGGSLLYLIDAYGETGSLYDAWDEIEGWEEEERKANVGLHLLDHLTHNVKRGQMRTWSGFYGDVFAFEEQKYSTSRARRRACSPRP
jgi:4-hydroxyphenylpyruvate dioxygenase